MLSIFANHMLGPQGWAQDVRLTIDDGLIIKITPNTTHMTGDTKVDTLLPALANLHSHSFQRAMAGMTEVKTAGKDSFWTWRKLMYQFTQHITPAQYQAIAALTFMEMQQAGYASVGEFHYVHHQKGGIPFDSITELSEQVFAASVETGIGLTHLPVLYSYGGAGAVPLSPEQQRFGNSVDSYAQLVEQARNIAQTTLPADCRVGIAPHSLRATNPDDLTQVLQIQNGNPVHIHISEQLREVTEIQQWLGARPVDWLLENQPVNSQWCLIHATHMTSHETKTFASSGAIAGLCPITEANLGDGTFNGAEFIAAGGKFGIGSDSNTRISLTEELRLLEYSQRLRDGHRNVLINGTGSVGESLYLNAAEGGAQALGRGNGRLETGQCADLMAIDSSAPALLSLRENQLLDGLVFAASDNIVTDVWSAGRHCVKDGQHIARCAILAKYRSAISGLLESL